MYTAQDFKNKSSTRMFTDVELSAIEELENIYEDIDWASNCCNHNYTFFYTNNKLVLKALRKAGFIVKWDYDQYKIMW